MDFSSSGDGIHLRSARRGRQGVDAHESDMAERGVMSTPTAAGEKDRCHAGTRQSISGFYKLDVSCFSKPYACRISLEFHAAFAFNLIANAKAVT
jgi:hypothetical protein